MYKSIPFFIVNNGPTFLMDYSRGEGLPSSVLKMGEWAICRRKQTRAPNGYAINYL